MTGVRQVQVAFDCASPRAVADFWKAALGYVDPPFPPDPDDAWAVCQDPTGVGPRLYFQRVPEVKVAKNRVHLDVRVGSGLTDDENESCQTMVDVEGNEFCLD